MKRLAAPALLALAACGANGEEIAAASPTACVQEVFEASRFTHCTVDPEEADVALVLDGEDGKPLRNFEKLAAMEPEDGVILAMNAGMFDEAGEPIGLLVIDGREVKALNRNDGPGNFHLQPNGVFHGAGADWHVETTEAYAAGKADPGFATQSGPILLTGGKLHPDFAQDGDSRHFRNGVGVDRAGHVHFVISDDLVSFGKFGRFFRDVAKTPDALYLDGAVSQLWAPEIGRRDGGPPLGPLIVVTKPAKAKP
ncbi:phosphodiester glycosidase family protein [Croceicoccus sp. BE223]|uniref:phosphodiester glycosidase family protein n=1 Tax=Croceicoccus sp. BE223 TaxID=2817716 RepID=UPI00286416BC|nr:phosphodiester glycosidase family protein [Croceicoccus sp. BE223]MDR7103341.1 uncharacterized protein YigE (DUF2233 family) [Croceicoccus sp. BE223]